MHTSTYEVPGYGEVQVLHNGDWSGEAEVVWTDGGEDRRAAVPAKLLVRIGMKVAVDFVRSEMIGTLEQMEANADGAAPRDLLPSG